MSWTTGDEGRRLETICNVTKDADLRQYVMCLMLAKYTIEKCILNVNF